VVDVGSGTGRTRRDAAVSESKGRTFPTTPTATPSSRSGGRSSSGSATMQRSVASGRPSSGSPAESTRPSSRRSPSTPSGRKTSPRRAPVSLLLRGIGHRRARPRRQPRHPSRDPADRRSLRRRERDARPAVLRTTRERHRGEHPVAPPGPAPDGAFQQVRPPRPDDREQERARRRLLHALRRHVRRPRPISDLPKMRVYALARHLKRARAPAAHPEATLTKPPSAELRPGQTDQDSLPPYRSSTPSRGPRREESLRRGDRETLEGAARLVAAIAASSTARNTSGLRPRLASRSRRRRSAPAAASRSRRGLPPERRRPGPRYPWKPIPGSSHEVLLSKIEARGTGLRLFDVGFGAGELARRVRGRCAYLAGIELDAEAARASAHLFDRCVARDLVESLKTLDEPPFDVVVAGRPRAPPRIPVPCSISSAGS